MEAPPAPAAGMPALPKLSTSVLLAIAAISVFVLASIFGYILLFATTLRIDERLWWTGLASVIFSLAFFMVYATTRDRKIARPLAGGFFVVGAGSFYGSIFTGVTSDIVRLLYLIFLSVLVIIVLGAIFVMARDAEQDAVRKATRKHIP